MALIMKLITANFVLQKLVFKGGKQLNKCEISMIFVRTDAAKKQPPSFFATPSDLMPYR